MITDHTNKFIELRNRLKRPSRKNKMVSSEVEPFLTDKTIDSSETELLSPNWVNLSNDIEHIFGIILNKSKRLKELFAKRLDPIFDDKIEQKLDQKISKLDQSITKQIETAENNVKAISIIEQNKISNDEKTVRLNAMRFNANKLKNITKEIQKKQKAFYTEKEKQRRQIKPDIIPKLPKSLLFLDEAENDFLDGDNEKENFDTKNLKTETKQIEKEELDVEELDNIARSTESISKLFNELGALAIDQRSKLDRIDYAIETSLGHMEIGVAQLKITRDNQLSSTSSMVIVWLLIAICVCFLIILIK